MPVSGVTDNPHYNNSVSRNLEKLHRNFLFSGKPLLETLMQAAENLPSLFGMHFAHVFCGQETQLVC